MDDDKQDDTASPGSARKRPPPTIDLTAASVSDSSGGSGQSGPSASSEQKPRKSWRARFAAMRAAMTPRFRKSSASVPKQPKPVRGAFLSMLVAGFTGALAALLVLGVWWFADSSGGSSRILSRFPSTTAKGDMESPGKRVTKTDAKAPVSQPDPALTARLDALEKSVASLRSDLDEIKAAPALAPDTSAIEERMSKIERATVALTGEMASTQKAASDDPRLRRIAVAATLDAAVNRGEPYAVALSAARSAAEDASILQPLDQFADKGVPSAPVLNRELIGLLTPTKPAVPPQPSGVLDRLTQSALKLVRVRRVDDDEAARIAARATSAARRDDLAAARREVEALSGPDRAPLAAWIEKVDAREAALAAARQFASNAAATLPRPAQ
ncbi:MAG: hypothetical protein J0I29_09405 [Rhizobiales bacterium]|nr:hypothetical protein [Hyphomicrobiales bacterium]